MEKYRVSADDIWENLKNEIRDDVRWDESQEKIEEMVISDLSDLKRDLWFEQKMVDTLYRKEYKDFLKSKQWNGYSLPFDRLQSIKESVILRDITANESLYSSPNMLMNIMYKISGIDLDLTKNSQLKNIVKWMIDEMLSTVNMYADILKDISGVTRSFVQFLKNISIEDFFDYWKSMGYDIWTLDLSSILWQYKFWRRIITITMMVINWARQGVTEAVKLWGNLASFIFNGIVTQGVKSTWDVDSFLLWWVKNAAAGTTVVKSEVDSKTSWIR